VTTSVTRLRVAGGGLACAAIVAGCVAALSGHAEAGTDKAADHYKVLTGPRAAGDSDFFASPMARQMARLNQESAPEEASARTRLTRVAGAESTTRLISVASGTHGRVCLGHRASSESGPLFITCALIGDAVKYGLVSLTHPAPGPETDPKDADVTVLVPDGITSVTFALSNGTKQVVNVTDNTVAAHLSDPVSLSFGNAAGARTVNLKGR
jgi:hypothetical protein